MGRIAVVLLCLVLPVSCTSPRLIGGGPYHSHAAPTGPEPGGLRYYVGKDLLVVSGKRTTKTKGVVLPGAGLQKRTSETSEGTVALQTVPDADKVFRLDIQPGGTSDDTLTVKLRGGGILESVNVLSQSKAGSILKNVTKFAGTIAGIALGMPPGLDQVRSLAADGPGIPPDLGTALKNALRGKRFNLEGSERSIAEVLVTERVPRLTAEERFVIAMSPHAMFLMAQGIALDALLLGRQQERIVLNRKVGSGTELSKDQLKNSTDRIKALGEAMKVLAAERDAAYVALQTEIERYFAAEGAAAETDEVEFRRVVRIPDVPSPAVLSEAGQLRAEYELADIEEALQEYAAMHALFEDTGVFLTLTAAPQGVITAKRDLGVAPCAPTPPGVPECTGRVFYRQSYPAVLSTWVRTKVKHELPGVRDELERAEALQEALDEDIADLQGSTSPEDQKELAKAQEERRKVERTIERLQPFESAFQKDEDVVRLVKQEIVEIMDPRARVEFLAFDPIAFAKHDLGLTFDEKSRILSLTRETTSAVEGFTGALAASAAGLRDEYATTLGKMVEIDENRRKLALSGLETQAQTLKKRKEVVDARIALQGATASEALVLEQKQLEQQLALLQAQTNLISAQQTQDLTLEFNQLKAQLDALTQELAVLKMQKELEEQD